MNQCSSCKAPLANQPGSASFPCPNCGKTTINRCKHCREVVAKYTCPSCGFEGPN